MATLPFFLWFCYHREFPGKTTEKRNFRYGAGSAFVLTFRRFSADFKSPEKIQQK